MGVSPMVFDRKDTGEMPVLLNSEKEIPYVHAYFFPRHFPEQNTEHESEELK